MKREITFKEFKTEKKAEAFMAMRNGAYKAAGNRLDKVCLVDGPENNFIIMDLMSAIKSEFLYKISVPFL